MNANFKINGKVIKTKRLILRSFKDSDLDDFYNYASVNGVGEMAGWKHHATLEETKEILNLFIEEDKVFAICLKENNKVIGSLGIEEYGMEDELSEFFNYKGREIGFVLSKDYWGRGIIPEAGDAIIDYLFNEIDLDFIICGYYDFNKQSKRVQEKLGFIPYRNLIMNTRMETKEAGHLNLLLNPNKKITLDFSHKETLIYPLFINLDKLHTTVLGEERIKKNLGLSEYNDAIEYSKKLLLKASVSRKGKNYYCKKDNMELVINCSSYTIITAHIK